VAKRRAAGSKIDKAGSDQILASTQAQYSYLSSGRLLFNDEAGVLMNRLADVILEKDTTNRKLINIYAYYSSGNNIICFPNGLILVELGLVAQLENEDQLAFVLSHAIAHFLNGDYYTEENAVKPDYEEGMDEYLKFRHDREYEADLLGFELYKKAKFSPAQALRAFDVMQRNWLVPEPLPFSFSCLRSFDTPVPLRDENDHTDTPRGSLSREVAFGALRRLEQKDRSFAFSQQR